MTPTTPAPTEGTHPQRCGFVPPYLLQRVAETARERRLVADGRDTLAVDEAMRTRRAEAGASTTPLAPDTGGNRVVYDAHGTETLPGTRVRDADDPATGDAAVDEAHDHAGVAWDLFADVFARPSVDGRGTPLSVTVHYGRDYDNAFWDGTQLVFGDGDGQVFDRFTKPVDVTVHEFTHGVTQFTAGLTYQGQSGALNESVSDVFASMAKQRVLGQTADQADWLIGEGLFLPDVKATALRSMLAPGTAYDDPRLGRDPQVGSMDAYVDTAEDSGGVHINSGIPNRAFALAAQAVGGSQLGATGPGLVRRDHRRGRHAVHRLRGLRAGDGRRRAAAVPRRRRRGGARDAGVAAGRSAGRRFRGGGRAARPGRRARAGHDAVPDPATPAGPGSASGPASGVPALPGEEGDDVVAVRRTGGFTGTPRFAEMSLGNDSSADELRRLLSQISVSGLTPSEPQPDRFTYTVACRSFELTVPEQDLTPELSRVVQIVLDQQDR